VNVIETLSKLVSINSVSANTNAEIVGYLTKRVETKSFRVKRHAYTDERSVEKINMIAVAGANSFDDLTVELALVGHTDTVPFKDDWTNALTLTEEAGKLYGRGSCDTKGFIAAALTAVEAVDLSQLKKPLALVFTADEEVGCIGAKKLADARPFKAKNAIVGEPTSLQPIRAGKGYCLAEVTFKGREGHSAYPSAGANAIYRAARLVVEIEKIAEGLKQDVRAQFEPPYTTLNVGIINGGSAKNIIAGECRFTLEWRPVPNQKASRVLDLISQAAEREKEKDADFVYEIKPLRLDEGMQTPADTELVKFLESETGKQSGTIAFGTESPQMIELGAHAVVLGPGDIRVAHRTGEFVPIDELKDCARILQRAIEKFCF
jgi:acetylornithine deacetylase